jgi:uncharacterized membrane protein
MTVTVDPVWSWLWSVSLASLAGPLGEIGLAPAGLLLAVWLLGLVLIMPGAGTLRRRRISLGFCVPVILLVLAYLPVGLAAALLVAGLTVWTYAGAAKVTWRRLLAVLGLRLGALAVAFMMALRPSLAFQEDPRIPSTLIIAVDCSQSMDIKDELGQSRWERALAILRSDRCTELLKPLKTDRNVEIVFYRAAEDVQRFDPAENAGRADGKRTDMGLWLEELHKRHAGDPNLRGLVLFSDGADNGARYSPFETAEKWGRIPCPIYTFSLGKKTTTLKQRGISFLPDSIIADPSPVAVKNKLTVKARLLVNGYHDPKVPVRLFLDNDRKAVAVKSFELNRPITEGSNIYEVQLTCDAPPKPREMRVTLKVDNLPGEITPNNKNISTFVTVTKEGISVLYVEGAYRWEARFIRDAINGYRNLRLYKSFRTREEPSPGNEPDWFRFNKYHYDVIIIGDISAKRFSGDNRAVLQQIKKLVEDDGTGLLMLGGFETFGNSDWNTPFAKPIADILPVKLDRQGNLDEKEKVKVVPTQAGFEHYIMRLDSDPAKNRTIWDSLPPLEGMTLLGTPRGDATVMAVKKGTKEPILVSRTVGKGRTLAFACDTTAPCWMRTPEAFQARKRFWQQVVVWLAHQENVADSVRLTPDTRRVAVGGKLGFRVGLRGKDDKKVRDARFRVKVVGPGKAETPVQIAGNTGKEQYGTFWKTNQPGEYRLEAVALGKDNKPVKGQSASVRFLIYEDDMEYRRPAASPETLDKIARRSDGQQRPATEENFARFLEELQKKPLPQGAARAELWPDWKQLPASRDWEDQLVTLWTSGVLVCLLLFVTLLCLEWFFRRRWGLV